VRKAIPHAGIAARGMRGVAALTSDATDLQNDWASRRCGRSVRLRSDRQYLASLWKEDCVGLNQNSANFASMTSASAAQPISRIEFGAG
jgi:hypothetical protein